MIKIENLSKVFRTEEVETTALNNVSLEVKKGEFVAIMGPSGKSTLLNIIGLLDNPTDGKYYFDGEEVGHLKEKQRTQVRKGNIGFVFQSFNLIDELNVYENVELPLIYLKKKASEKKEIVSHILDRMNISHRAKHFPQQLSGGQQQRVAIARYGSDEPTDRIESGRYDHHNGDSLPARCLLCSSGNQSFRRADRHRNLWCERLKQRTFL